MSRKTICVKCAWNNGAKRKKNAYGQLDSVRDCAYLGTVPTWAPVKKCAGWKAQ
jgi:hypothetical protein